MILASLVLAPTLLVIAPMAHADQFVNVGNLPERLFGTAAVTHGSVAYVFGGARPDSGGAVGTVTKFTPGGSAVLLDANVGGRARFAAVTDGKSAYLFSGVTHSSSVVRFDFKTEAVEFLPTLVPGMTGHAAIFDPRPAPGCPAGCAYIFGGWRYPEGRTAEILRFDPSSGALTVMGGKLPTPRTSLAAAFDGSRAYVFGGTDPSGNALRQAVAYDPVTDKITLTATPPGAMAYASAVWGDTAAYVVNGWGERVYRYEADANRWQTMAFTNSYDASAAWVGDSTYVFGGARHHAGNVNVVDLIVKHVLSPNAPQNVRVSQTSFTRDGPTVRWDPPASNTYVGAIFAYHIERAVTDVGPNAPVLAFAPLATVAGDARDYADATCPLTKECHYRVAAENAAGRGRLSPVVSAYGWAV